VAFVPGSRLGSYEFLAPIGAGGMGEVYRAWDAKVGRHVAIKVLPETLARDVDRIARFRHETEVLASLNHPNIASLYGFEDSATSLALVMELAEGPTLADRILQGPILLDEVWLIAGQIAHALEYAHERSVAHRDFRPSNVKLIGGDTVKVLDLGFVKALEGFAVSTDGANAPTSSEIAERPGTLLGTSPGTSPGTAAYISPEQANGKAADRRADIWAFGCVLYEMLTGKMAFRGATVTETLEAVVNAEPDWTELPAATPPHVRTFLRGCLQKDSLRRLQTVADRPRYTRRSSA
jgi:eukaryotic-like serine/threonine-protein kinase